MNDTLSIIVVIGALASVFLVAAAPVSAALVRLRAARLPIPLALRMEEEWLCELNSISSRPGKLAFAVALILTRRRAFVAPGEIVVSEIAAFGSRKSLVLLSALVFAVAAYGASFLVPVKYESEAMLQSRDGDGLLLRKARSDSLLASVVEEMPNGGAGWRERTIEDLRNNVTVTALSDASVSGSLFLVKYRAPDPTTARQVTAKLTERIIEQDMGRRYEQLEEEKRFLQDELAKLSARVEDKSLELALLKETGRADKVGMLALDHELLVSSYKALFAKYQDVERAASLKSAGFAIVDAPQLGREVVPNRAAFGGVGAFIGFAMGGTAVFGLSRRQRRLLASELPS